MRTITCGLLGILIGLSDCSSVLAIPPDKATQIALAEATKIEFVDTPLSEVIELLAKQHKVPITLNEETLTDVGIPTDEPISFSIEGISLDSALKLILNNLGLRATPAADGGLEVTTSEVADERVDQRRYDLRPLAGLIGQTPQQVINLLQKCTHGHWEDIDGIGGTVSLAGPSLVVNQTNEMHNQIQDLLTRLTRVTSPRQAPRVSLREKNEQALHQALRKSVTVEFVDTPLDQAIAELSKLANVPIFIDGVALRDHGFPTDEPINLSEEQRSLGEVLNLILEPGNLACLIDNEVLLVTSHEQMEERLQVGLFDVRQQLRNVGGSAQLIGRLHQLDGAGPWEQIDGIGGTAVVVGGILVVYQHQAALQKIAAALQ